MRRGKNSSQARLETPFLIAISGSAVLLLSSVLSSTIMQSVYPQPSGEQGRLTEESQPSLPSDEQERLIEEARPGVPEEERLIEEAGPGVAEDERLIEESQPSLSSGEQGKLIEEIVKQGSFLMPVEDIRAILEVKEKNTQAAPLAVVGDNVYVLWWENKTGNWEIFFRASSDNGQAFGDEINLSNDATRSDDGNIAALGNNVYATWWNTNNQTGLREPVFIASDDNGATFGESVRLSGNQTTVAVGP